MYGVTVNDGNVLMEARNRGTPITFDMTRNWWRTADPDSIQAWIYDSHDQLARPYYYVQWEPYLTQPLAVQKRSLGVVKA